MRTLPYLALAALLPLLTQCNATARKAGDPSLATISVRHEKKMVSEKKGEASKPAAGTKKDDLDEYQVVQISDPIEGLNRATFWLNDKLYLVIFRPISKGYEAITPKRLRKGIYNVFENVKFPVRFLNDLLQGNVKRAGLDTEKFVVNTVGGVGGLVKMSDKIPSIADLPDNDMGTTFAKWGMGHGPYLVLPFLGPSSLRDGVGLIGDYAANPCYWGYFWPGDHDWTLIPPYGNTLRAMPPLLEQYDDAKQNMVDPYIAIRSAYVQFRDEAIKKN